MDRIRTINTAISGIKQAIPDIQLKLLTIKPSLISTEKCNIYVYYMAVTRIFTLNTSIHVYFKH